MRFGLKELYYILFKDRQKVQGVLNIPKLLWVINSVLFIILIYISVGLTSFHDAGKQTIANPILQQKQEEIIPFDYTVTPCNNKIIVERNIFGYSWLNPTAENLLHGETDNPASILKAKLRLFATVAGDDQVACAVIGNMKSNVQDVYKIGDIIEGAKIERIDRRKIILLCGEQREELKLHITNKMLDPVEKKEKPLLTQGQNDVESVNSISPVERDVNQKVYVTNVGGMETFLENIKAAPYIVNDKGEGLCITDLDDLKMARFFGFENGDVIQTINGQMLYNKQKTFQVLKKAKSQSSLNFQLLRNKQKMDLSFGIN